MSRFLPRLVYDYYISLLELSDILGGNCVEVKLCVLMVCLVMCLCMNKAIAWLGCRLFVDMVSQLSPQLSLEYNVNHCLIDDDLYMSIYMCIIC